MNTNDSVRAAIQRAADTAMRHAVKARVPECGTFGEIAQDLDYALSKTPADIETLRALLRETVEVLTCDEATDEPHWCPHCDEYVDRNSVLRDKIRAALGDE